MKSGLKTVLIMLSIVGGCATQGPDVTGASSQLQTRQIQTRQYETLDKKMTMRSVIATLQDLGFIIDDADPNLGIVTATRLHKYPMRMTVVVVNKGEKQVSVRASARIDERSVTDARTYQDFFVALDKAMFLTLNKVD